MSVCGRSRKDGTGRDDWGQLRTPSSVSCLARDLRLEDEYGANPHESSGVRNKDDNVALEAILLGIPISLASSESEREIESIKSISIQSRTPF